MKLIDLNGNKYEVLKNYKESLEIEELQSLFTEYFDAFDYVVGDYSYNKLRLKGFYDSKNKLVKNYNDIKNLETYLKEYCATECPYFLLKKQIKVEKKQ